MEITKLDLKLFASPAPDLTTEQVIPVFQRFIRDRALPDILIDVADYGHVPDGPGVLLIGHEHHYSFDLTGGEVGLLVSRRRGPDRGLDTLFRLALKAARLLETDEALAGRLRFPGDRLELRINDRLVRPRAGRPAPLSHELHELLGRIAPEAPAVVERADAGGRVAYSARLPIPLGVEALAAALTVPSAVPEPARVSVLA